MKIQKQLMGIGKGFLGFWKRLPPEGKIALIIVTLLIALPFTQSMIAYKGGWELNKTLDSVKVNGSWYSADSPPALIQNGDWGGSTVRFDVDEDKRGVPDIQVYTTSPREYVLNNRGEWVEATGTEIFENIQKVVGDKVFFFDHHVFRQQVMVTAFCDSNDIETIGISTFGEARGLYTALDAQVTVRLKVECNPWADYLVENITGESGSYLFENGWAAIMSSRIAESEAWYVGYTPPSAADTEGTKPIATGGAVMVASTTGDLNMWLPNLGSNPPTTQGGLPSVVYLDVDGTLLPAYSYDMGFLGLFPQWHFYPVYFKYVIELHVLTVAGYTLQTGKMDDDFTGIKYWDYILGGLSSWAEGVNAWLASLVPGMTLLGFVILAVVALVLVFLLRKALGIGGHHGE